MSNITHKQLSKAFKQWMQDYEDNPDSFAAEYSEASSYGDMAATQLMELLRQPERK